MSFLWRPTNVLAIVRGQGHIFHWNNFNGWQFNKDILTQEILLMFSWDTTMRCNFASFCYGDYLQAAVLKVRLAYLKLFELNSISTWHWSAACISFVCLILSAFWQMLANACWSVFHSSREFPVMRWCWYLCPVFQFGSYLFFKTSLFLQVEC